MPSNLMESAYMFENFNPFRRTLKNTPEPKVENGAPEIGVDMHSSMGGLLSSYRNPNPYPYQSPQTNQAYNQNGMPNLIQPYSALPNPVQPYGTVHTNTNPGGSYGATLGNVPLCNPLPTHVKTFSAINAIPGVSVPRMNNAQPSNTQNGAGCGPYSCDPRFNRLYGVQPYSPHTQQYMGIQQQSPVGETATSMYPGVPTPASMLMSMKASQNTTAASLPPDEHNEMQKLCARVLQMENKMKEMNLHISGINMPTPVFRRGMQ